TLRLSHPSGDLAWVSLSRRADTMNQLVLCMLLLLALGELAGACPAGCQCQDPKTILCAARRGQTVPQGLPPNTLSLYVFENGITMLSEDSFAGLPALQLLDLSQNKITSIQKNIFQPLTELRAVTAAGNPFNCICQMSWLVQWVNASSVVLRRPEETRCHFPPKNSGKLLHHLQYADFGCPTTTTTTPPTTPRTATLPPALLPTSSFWGDSAELGGVGKWLGWGHMGKGLEQA
uniref:LRRCT domain-containing protein n=1 Tax=Athene cunicularia TaxID=194338 RepID=A0A663LQ83_ATHCN